jgi:hypothetical protein
MARNSKIINPNLETNGKGRKDKPIFGNWDSGMETCYPIAFGWSI